MPAAYDHYNYPSFWIGREYEHKSEEIAIKSFLSKIKKLNKILEIGAGYGRITPTYSYRAKKIFLTDPSARLLRIANKLTKKNKNIKIIQSKAENLKTKFRNKTFDLIILIRVIHHLEDLDEIFSIIKSLTKNKGYLIIEFANKAHLKANFKQFIKGDFVFPFDIFPMDIRSSVNKKKKTLPFKNYHPYFIKEKLEKQGYQIIQTRSVSNIRNKFLKKILPLDLLLLLEKYSQVILSKINFGPSIFILAQKTESN
jgi:ubiquinone/menaquinone biosynthesis C-methylase UbiE